MSWWKYKPMFEIKWKQPQVVSRAQAFPESKVGMRARAAAVSGICLILAVGLVFSAGRELRTPPAIIGLMVSVVMVGLLSVYLPYWANQWFSREVGIGEKAVVLMLPTGVKAWRYEQISEVRFVHACIGGEGLWM